MTINSRSSVAEKSPFGILLARLRTRRGLTQEGLASATGSERISSRSITNYERSATNPRDWILPHRPGLRSLSKALRLDAAEDRALADAWNETRALKEARLNSETATNFVSQGREAVIARIMAAWDKALQGTPQFVMLGGDTGIGKSTIASHISDVIAASTNKVMITWGEAHSWAPPVEPYMAIRHATDRMLVPPPPSYTLPGLYPNRPHVTGPLVERVLSTIPHLGGVLISESTFRQLATTLGPMDHQSIDSLLESHSATESIGRWDEYARLIADVAQYWPIVMVLEDMHWIGELTGSLLLHLVHHLGHRTDVPLMVLCTYRSHELVPSSEESQHPFARFLQHTQHLPSVTHIPMHETLWPNHGTSFIRGYLGTMPMVSNENHDELVDWLFQRTSGHPMFTTEMIRHLRESEALVQQGKNATWRFDPQNAPTGLSPAINTLIAQRVAPINRRGRYVLEVASALGETLLPEVIARVTDMDEDELLDLMDTVLVEHHEMLSPGSVITLNDRTHQTYFFQHALLREYIYNEIKPARKRRIHLEIADALSQIFANTDITAMGEMTHHYVKAEDWHSAQMSAYRLAQLMTGRLDWELASAWFDQAENLALRAQDPQQLWRVRAARLVVMRGTNKYDEGLALANRVLHQATMQHWQAVLGLTHHHIGEMLHDQGHIDESIEHLEQAHAIHEQEHEYDLAAAALAMLSHSSYRQGKYDVAREYARRSLEYSHQINNSWVRSEAMLAAANCDIDLGYYEQAIEGYRAAIEIASMDGKLTSQLAPASNIGLALVMLGRYEEAISQLNPVIARLSVHSRLRAHGQFYLGLALERAGELEAALEVLQDSADFRRGLGSLPTLYDSLAAMMSIHIRLKDADAVRSLLHEIEDYIDSAGMEGIEDPALALLSVARAHEMLGDDEMYRSRLEQAHALVMERAARIEDPEALYSYLNNVPVNAAIERRYNAAENT